jgi:hypothetical protein
MLVRIQRVQVPIGTDTVSVPPKKGERNVEIEHLFHNLLSDNRVSNVKMHQYGFATERKYYCMY